MTREKIIDNFRYQEIIRSRSRSTPITHSHMLGSLVDNDRAAVESGLRGEGGSRGGEGSENSKLHFDVRYGCTRNMTSDVRSR